MRVESVRYEKLVNLGNYQNQKVGVTVVARLIYATSTIT